MIFDAHLSRIYIQYSILYMLYTDKQIKTVVYRKFLSLSYVTQKKTPAEVIIAGRYRVGKKIANGAFGQLRYRKVFRYCFFKTFTFQYIRKVS